MADPSDSSGFVEGSSTTLSVVGTEMRQMSKSGTSDLVGISSSTPSTSDPSEGGIHGWWKVGETFSSRSSH